MRILRDPDGREWHVWRVIPDPKGYLERRREQRRRQGAERAGPERREGSDRRRGGSIMDGWLVFQCGEEKRRLVPAPVDWEKLRDDRLSLLLRMATRAS